MLDSLVALAVVVLDEYAIGQPWDDGTRAGSLVLNAPLVALAVVPLALRRTRPAVALTLMVAALALPGLIVADDFLFWGGFLPLMVVGLHGCPARRRVARGGSPGSAPLVVIASQGGAPA